MDGQKSKIRIVFADARNNGENQEWGTRTIGKSQTLSVNMLLAPNKDGMVSVYRDGDFLETYPITYVDVKNNNVQTPEPPPVQTQTPEPTVAPTETPVEPTIEPEILPPGSGEGEETGAGDQTGFVPGKDNNNKLLAASPGNGKGKGKDKNK